MRTKHLALSTGPIGRSPIKTGVRALAPGLILLALQGCALEDATAHREFVSLNAGETQANNSAIHTINPWPTYVMDTKLSNDGRRAAQAVSRYSDGNKGPDPSAGLAKPQAFSGATTGIADQQSSTTGPVTKN
jgi:hypothetical protein